ELNTTITNINATSSKILSSLNGTEVEPKKLDALIKFRDAIGCSNQGLATVVLNAQSFNADDETKLQQWKTLATAAQSVVDQYLGTINQKIMEDEQRRRLEEAQAKKEAGMREQVQTQVQTLNLCLTQIKAHLDPEAKMDAAALQEVSVWR